MAIYTCKLGSTGGRILEKEFEAADPVMLRQSLEEQGYFVFAIQRKSFQFLLNKGLSRRGVDKKQLITFNQELLVLIKAGLPIIQVLDAILERMEKGRLSETLRAVREDVKGGAALSDAFEKFSSIFPSLYIASIRAGEKTGDLPQNLRRFIEFAKRSEMLKKKLISALIYPCILVTVAFAAISLLLVWVVPTFSQIYADSGSALPLPTQILITSTGFLKNYLIIILAVVLFCIGVFRRWSRTENGRFWTDSKKLQIPFLGETYAKYALVSFTRTLATVLGSGVPIVQALKMSVGTLNNRLLERRLLDAVVRVEEGLKLSTALEATRMMPPLALRMLGAGESTGSMEEMLNDISEHFEEEIEGRLTVLTTAIEPIIMIFMGLVIGSIVITMYLPIFKIAGTVQ